MQSFFSLFKLSINGKFQSIIEAKTEIHFYWLLFTSVAKAQRAERTLFVRCLLSINCNYKMSNKRKKITSKDLTRKQKKKLV